MQNIIPVYVGVEPYIFVSYAHTDNDHVMTIIQWLNDNYYRVWYDEGVEIGQDFPTEIVIKLKECTQFVIVISDTSVNRRWVKKEVQLAEYYNKKILPIYLEKTSFPIDIEHILVLKQGIRKYELDEETFFKYLEKGVKKECQGANSAMELTLVSEHKLIWKEEVTRVTEETRTKIGDYILFGTYYAAPVLWRVIHLDQQGNPLLFSEKILCLKVFDAGGSYHTDSERRKNGSNYWTDSNIRQWLNSSQDKIDWIQNAPSAANLVGQNTYDTEPGFLSENNFTLTERTAIMPVIHPVLLAKIDNGKRDGGAELHQYEHDIEKVITNYNQAYYQNVTDSMFFLDVRQLKEYVNDRGWKINSKPTPEAVRHNKSIFSNFVTTSKYCDYSLSSPFATTSDVVRMVKSDGSVYFNVGTGLGTRPACYINLSTVIFTSGSGIEINPYRIKR